MDARREPLDLDAEVLGFAENRPDRPYRLLVVATKVSSMLGWDKGQWTMHVIGVSHAFVSIEHHIVQVIQ